MEKDKLIIRTNKQYSCGDSAVRVLCEVLDRVKEISKETNREIKSLVAEMLEFALERIELQ